MARMDGKDKARLIGKQVMSELGRFRVEQRDKNMEDWRTRKRVLPGDGRVEWCKRVLSRTCR